MLIPLTTEEITVGWFENILNIKIDSESFVATGNVNAGVGFLSNLVRVRFEEICSDGFKTEHSVVVKLLPPQDYDRQLVLSEKLDKSELHFYEKFIPELLNEVPSLDKYFCPFVYGNIQEENSEKRIPYASVLVLKDLKNDGYILKPFSTEELSQEEIHLTLDFFASFHAASTLLEIKKGEPLCDIFNVFPEWYYPNERKDRQFVMHKWFIEGFQHAKDFLNEFTTNIESDTNVSADEIITNLIEPLAPYAQEIFNEVLRAGQLFPSLIHGDLWQNNILIAPGNPSSIKIIDWQMTGYSDSVYDITVFLLTSLYPNLDMQKMEEQAKVYFERLENIYYQKEKEGINFHAAKRRSWEEFWQAMKTYGVAFVFIVYIVGCNNVKSFPENYCKLFEALRFFYYEANLASFLRKALNINT